MTTLRALTLEEMRAYNTLSSVCFTYTTSTENLSPKEMSPEKLNEVRGMFDENGTLLGAMIQIGMDCRFEGHDCRFLGIGGVVTDPAERRRGAIRQLFEEGLPRLYHAGFVFSALYPFSHRFYRKFGYELGIVQRNAELSPSSLRSDLYRAASIRRLLPEEDGAAMREVYQKYIEKKNFAVLRHDGHWYSLREGTPWEKLKYTYVLYDEGGAPIAYWVGTMEKGPEGATLSIKDLAYTSRKGLEAIFAMIRTMNEVGGIKMPVPQDVELRFLVEDPYDIQENTSCGGMLRVMNVARALALLPAPAIPGRCTVEVTDGQIPGNNGRFTIIGDGERLSVEKTDEPADLTCTVNGLSALVAGTLDFAGCADARLVAVQREDQLRFMQMLFCKRQQHLHNYF